MFNKLKKWRQRNTATPLLPSTTAAVEETKTAAAAAAAVEDDEEDSPGTPSPSVHVTLTPAVLTASDASIDDTSDSFGGSITMGMSPAQYNKSLATSGSNSGLPALLQNGSLPPKPKAPPADALRAATSGSTASLSVDPLGMGLSQKSITRTSSRTSLSTVAAALGAEAEEGGFNEAPAQEATLIAGELDWEYKVNKWKKRRFMLTREALTYVRDSPSLFQKKYVPVVRVSDMATVDQDMTCLLIHDSCFLVKPRNGMPFYFKSGDMRVTEEWLEVLRELISQPPTTTTTTPTSTDQGAGR